MKDRKKERKRKKEKRKKERKKAKVKANFAILPNAAPFKYNRERR
jgi:hypothetical protein